MKAFGRREARRYIPIEEHSKKEMNGSCLCQLRHTVERHFFSEYIGFGFHITLKLTVGWTSGQSMNAYTVSPLLPSNFPFSFPTSGAFSTPGFQAYRLFNKPSI